MTGTGNQTDDTCQQTRQNNWWHLQGCKRQNQISGGFGRRWHAGKAELAEKRPVNRRCRISKPQQPGRYLHTGGIHRGNLVPSSNTFEPAVGVAGVGFGGNCVMVTTCDNCSAAGAKQRADYRHPFAHRHWTHPSKSGKARSAGKAHHYGLGLVTGMLADKKAGPIAARLGKQMFVTARPRPFLNAG